MRYQCKHNHYLYIAKYRIVPLSEEKHSHSPQNFPATPLNVLDFFVPPASWNCLRVLRLQPCRPAPTCHVRSSQTCRRWRAASGRGPLAFGHVFRSTISVTSYRNTCWQRRLSTTSLTNADTNWRTGSSEWKKNYGFISGTVANLGWRGASNVAHTFLNLRKRNPFSWPKNMFDLD